MLPVVLLMNLRPHKEPGNIQKRAGLRPYRPCEGWSRRACKSGFHLLLNGPSLPQPQGIESIDQIASLCQSDLETVRAAAREATLSFGKEQHQMSCAVQWGSWVLRRVVLERP